MLYVAQNGNLEVVKYLAENGAPMGAAILPADIHADYDLGLRWTTFNGI